MLPCTHAPAPPALLDRPPAEEATRAVTEMNGRMIKSKPIYVALAQVGAAPHLPSCPFRCAGAASCRSKYCMWGLRVRPPTGLPRASSGTRPRPPSFPPWPLLPCSAAMCAAPSWSSSTSSAWPWRPAPAAPWARACSRPVRARPGIPLPHLPARALPCQPILPATPGLPAPAFSLCPSSALPAKHSEAVVLTLQALTSHLLQAAPRPCSTRPAPAAPWVLVSPD